MDKQPPPPEREDRLQQLEEALAHLTRLTEDLSQVIARQDRDLTRLARRLDLLLHAEAERQADAPGQVALTDPPPPHY